MAVSVNFYLDLRAKSESNSYPIKIRITKNRRSAFLATGLKVAQEEWRNQRVTARPDKNKLNDFLDALRYQVLGIIYDFKGSGRYAKMTAADIKNEVDKRINGKEDKPVTFLAFFDEFAESRDSERTKEIYRVTARKLRSILPYPERITFDKITFEWLEKLNKLLIKRGNNGSTRNLDFRNIRAVVKYAKKMKLLEDNPFDDFDFPVAESSSRALNIDELRTFINADLQPWERKYMDFFLLSLYLIGMNTEDMLHIRKMDGERINYVRSKTGKDFSVKVEPEALEIIERYRGQEFLLNILDTYSNTHNWTSKVDNVLKAIAKRNGLPEVTMYWARHTWATLVHADLGYSLNLVGEALGQQPSFKVVQIYVRRKDNRQIDEANRRLIDYVLEKDSHHYQCGPLSDEAAPEGSESNG